MDQSSCESDILERIAHVYLAQDASAYGWRRFVLGIQVMHEPGLQD